MARLLYVLVDSDLHFQNGQIRHDKLNNVQRMLKEENVDAICVAGDITEGNHPTYIQWLTCSWAYDNCTQTFINQYFNLLELKHRHVYVVPGNHDRIASSWSTPFYKRYWEIDTFCNQHYGGCFYTAELNHNVTLIALGVYPNSEALSWFENLGLDKEKPLILMWHYNVSDDTKEPYSDWWTNEEKQACYNLISQYNVLCIIVGHIHDSAKVYWHGIPVVRGAGKGYARVTINVDDVSVKYKRV